MQSRPRYTVITNQTAQLFRQQLKCFGDECPLRCRFKLSVQNVHQLQQHMIEVSFFSKFRIVLSINSSYQGSLQLGTVGWFWHTFLIPSQDRAPHTIIQWTEIWISVRLFLSQNHSCSLWKMHI